MSSHNQTRYQHITYIKLKVNSRDTGVEDRRKSISKKALLYTSSDFQIH